VTSAVRDRRQHPSRAAGAPTVSPEEPLWGLLHQEKLRNALGEDHLFFVEYVLSNPEMGPNLRNELAHANAPPWSLTAPRVFLMWLLVVRLTFFGPVAAPTPGTA
jgi:hypothetical protein